MTQKTIFVDADKRHLAKRIDGAAQMIELTAEHGKALKHNLVDGEWLSVAVDSVDGWAEVDPTPEPPTDEEALTRYANELTGADDTTLIEATETLITEKIKEEH